MAFSSFIFRISIREMGGFSYLPPMVLAFEAPELRISAPILAWSYNAGFNWIRIPCLFSPSCSSPTPNLELPDPIRWWRAQSYSSSETAHLGTISDRFSRTVVDFVASYPKCQRSVRLVRNSCFRRLSARILFFTHPSIWAFSGVLVSAFSGLSCALSPKLFSTCSFLMPEISPRWFKLAWVSSVFALPPYWIRLFF